MERISLDFDQLAGGRGFDAVVVGSGYGGSITAYRLATALGSNGRVCVLERGREILRYPESLPEAFQELQAHDYDAGWHLGDADALFDARLHNEVNVIVGCALGGTSIINANVSLFPDPEVFQQPEWPSTFHGDIGFLTNAANRARSELQPVEWNSAQDPERFPPLQKQWALGVAARALGHSLEFPPINVTAKAGSCANMPSQGCVRCGNCVMGCNHEAKNTLLMNYLPKAKVAGASLYAQTRVRSIERRDEKWVLHCAGPEGRTAEKEVFADVVVLAAGTLGSAEILFRSRLRGLALSPTLGARFSANGDLMAFACRTRDRVNAAGYPGGDACRHEPNWGIVGPTITGAFRVKAEALRDRILVEEGAIPGALVNFTLDLMARLVRPGPLDPTPFFSAASRRALEVSPLTHPLLRRIETFLAMIHDTANGKLEFRERADGVVVSWRNFRDEHAEKLEQVAGILSEAARAMGGHYLRNPIQSRLFGERHITVHPLGGCVMADDASRGVTDDRGRVFSAATGTDVHPGLYVADASLIPTALGVNPLLTISALAEHISQRLIAERGWSPD